MKLSFFMVIGVFFLVGKVYANDPANLYTSPFSCNAPDQAGHPYDPRCYFSPYYTRVVYPSLATADQQIDRIVAKKSFVTGNWNFFRNAEDNRVNNYVAAESASRCLTQLSAIPKSGSPSCADTKALESATRAPSNQPESAGLAEALPRKLQEGDVCVSSQLPGSGMDHNLLQSIVADPSDPNTLYSMSAQYGASADQARYISKSVDGGRTWIPIRKIPSPPGNGIFEANELSTASLSVTAGGKNITFTTRNGVFQMPAPYADIKKLDLPKDVPAMEGGSIKLSPDQGTLAVSYGHLYHKDSRVLLYEKGADGQWVPKADNPPAFDASNTVPPALSSDVFSLQVCSDDASQSSSSTLYAGLGRHQYRYDPAQKKWMRIVGMESSDRSVYGTVCQPKGKITIATCGGIYEASKDKVTKKINGGVFMFRTDDHREVKGYTFLRALSIDQNPAGQMVVGSGTGVYFSPDAGKTWKSANAAISPALNDSTQGARPFTATHVNPDGSMLVSGSRGTYVLNKDGSCAK